MQPTVSLRDYGFDAQQELEQVELLTQVLPASLQAQVGAQLQTARLQVERGATDAAVGFLQQAQGMILDSPEYQSIVSTLSQVTDNKIVSAAIGSVASDLTASLSDGRLTSDEGLAIVKGAATTIASAGCSAVAGPLGGLACGAAAGLITETIWGGLTSLFSSKKAQQCSTCASDLLKARAQLYWPVKKAFDAYRRATGGSYNQHNEIVGGYVNYEALAKRLELNSPPVTVQLPPYFGAPKSHMFDMRQFRFVPKNTERKVVVGELATATENTLVSIDGWELRYLSVTVGSNRTYLDYWATPEALNKWHEFKKKKWDWGQALLKGSIVHFATSEGGSIQASEIPGGGYLGLARSVFGPEPTEDQQRAATAMLIAMENAAVMTVVGWWMEVVSRIEQARANSILQRNQEVMRRYEKAQAAFRDQQTYRELSATCILSNQSTPDIGTSAFQRKTCLPAPPTIRMLVSGVEAQLDMLTAGIGRGGMGLSRAAAAKKTYRDWSQALVDLPGGAGTANMLGPAVAEAAGLPACDRPAAPGLSPELCPDLSADIAQAREGSKLTFKSYADQMRHIDQTQCAPKGKLWSSDQQRCLSLVDAKSAGAAPEAIAGLKERQNCMMLGGVYDVWDRKCKTATEAHADAVAQGRPPPPGSKAGAPNYLLYAAAVLALGAGGYYATRYVLDK